MRRHLVFLLAGAATAMAQSPGSISAPVSRTVTLPLDEATFAITAAAGLDSTAQQVKAALQQAGLPNPTVVAVGVTQDNSRVAAGPSLIVYSATALIPASSAIDVSARLEALPNNLPAPLAQFQYTMALNPSQATIEAMRQTTLPQLLDDARRAAQSIAAASGVKLGSIRAMSDSPAATFAYVASGNPALRSGDFSMISYPVLASSARYTYYLNVVFATQ